MEVRTKRALPRSIRAWENRLAKSKEAEKKLRAKVTGLQKMLKAKNKKIDELEARLEISRDTIATMQRRLNTARNMAGAFVMGKTA